jgi:hypothetical protein
MFNHQLERSNKGVSIENKDDGNELYNFQPQWNIITLIEKEFPKTLWH